ncbi:Rap1a/Tai family immunity protein [Fundidesulfovibrio agrisoli]|uniref:Rap1a/Tai family immunity protein n=1 Tax=Fundidesulfovibrio agrisoli TaxID=2922717 RepID=UPI001FAC8A7F|nr:Rap1a/Tai family immunity protein [Fundidesulfovibrio agrisoli]
MFACALLCLLLAAAPASAKFVTPLQLMEQLDSGECTKNSSARGYILGVYDSFEGTLYAQHENLSEDELVRIVSAYLRTTAKETTFSAQVLIMQALEAHFKAKEGPYTVQP